MQNHLIVSIYALALFSYLPKVLTQTQLDAAGWYILSQPIDLQLSISALHGIPIMNSVKPYASGIEEIETHPGIAAMEKMKAIEAAQQQIISLGGYDVTTSGMNNIIGSGTNNEPSIVLNGQHGIEKEALPKTSELLSTPDYSNSTQQSNALAVTPADASMPAIEAEENLEGSEITSDEKAPLGISANINPVKILGQVLEWVPVVGHLSEWNTNTPHPVIGHQVPIMKKTSVPGSDLSPSAISSIDSDNTAAHSPSIWLYETIMLGLFMIAGAIFCLIGLEKKSLYLIFVTAFSSFIISSIITVSVFNTGAFVTIPITLIIMGLTYPVSQKSLNDFGYGLKTKFGAVPFGWFISVQASGLILGNFSYMLTLCIINEFFGVNVISTFYHEHSLLFNVLYPMILILLSTIIVHLLTVSSLPTHYTFAIIISIVSSFACITGCAQLFNAFYYSPHTLPTIPLSPLLFFHPLNGLRIHLNFWIFFVVFIVLCISGIVYQNMSADKVEDDNSEVESAISGTDYTETLSHSNRTHQTDVDTRSDRAATHSRKKGHQSSSITESNEYLLPYLSDDQINEDDLDYSSEKKRHMRYRSHRDSS